MTSQVGFFVCPNYLLLDLAGPFDAFESVNRLSRTDSYNLRLLSARGGTVVGHGGVPIVTRKAGDLDLDIVVFVGGSIASMGEPENIEAARGLATRARRVASVCTGAFLLAETGLLDGRRATTHWRAACELQRRHRSVKVEPDAIFLVDGHAWTSAGTTAGIDLALALIEADHGVEQARAVARELVVHHRRPGGQSQFSQMAHMEPESDRIRIALNFARDHLDEDLPVERMADAAHLSPRQFGRAFRRETGETPARAVERLRVEAARLRLQEGSEPIEGIARAVGFDDPERMRRAFIKLLGMPPQSVRRSGRLAGAAPIAPRLPVAPMIGPLDVVSETSSCRSMRLP